MEAFSRIPMIIETHMPSLCGSLPFIDHGAQLRRYDATKVKEREQMKFEAHHTIEALQWLKQGSRSVNKIALEDCWQ